MVPIAGFSVAAALHRGTITKTASSIAAASTSASTTAIVGKCCGISIFSPSSRFAGIAFIEKSPRALLDTRGRSGDNGINNSGEESLRRSPPLSDEVIRNLTLAQRDMLIAHVDGEVQVDRKKSDGARTALLARGLLRPSSTHTPRPTATVLTEDGRRALGIVLGSYADALVRAGLLEQTDPIDALRRLKETRAAFRKPESFVPDNHAAAGPRAARAD